MLNERIRQIRTNALAAEYIYTKKLKNIRRISILVNSLTVLVPIVFSAALFLAKGTSWENLVNVISVVLSALLLAIVVSTFILQIEQNKENYLIGRRANFYVSNEALRLTDKGDQELVWFYNYVSEMDAKDKENVGDISEGLMQRAHRNALKQLYPGRNDVVCSVCNESPFNFKKGSCQVCGNTRKV